jgi:hypothetical protein
MHLIPTVLCMVFGGVVLFLVGSVAGKRVTSRGGRTALLAFGLLLASPGLLFALYYIHVLDNAAWFYTFRALPDTELLGAGLGFVAGILNSWFAPETLGEKLFVPVVAFLFVLIPFIKPLLDPIDLTRLRDRCEGDVCLQSTFSTCGPCSAATLLKAFGETASEKQLAKECLTSGGGTEIWYIARAFQRRGYHTSVLIQKPQDLSPPSPAIAGVTLRGGVGHFIALVNERSGFITIADPMKGKLIVKKEDLAKYYHFTGFFLTIAPKSD